MTNFNPLAPELLEKMWAVYYHMHGGRQKKKTFLSNATELIKLMQTAIPGESEIPKKYKADSIKYGFDFDMWFQVCLVVADDAAQALMYVNW